MSAPRPARIPQRGVADVLALASYEARAAVTVRHLGDCTDGGLPGAAPGDVDVSPLYLAALLSMLAHAIRWCEERIWWADGQPDAEAWADAADQLGGDAAELERCGVVQQRRGSPNARVRLPGALVRPCAATLVRVLRAMDADGPTPTEDR